MELTQEVEKITILIYLAITFLTMILVVLSYNEYCELVKRKDSNSGGWLAGTYWVNPEVLVPINEKHENQTIQKVISKHSKLVKFFWFLIVIILPIMILAFKYS